MDDEDSWDEEKEAEFQRLVAYHKKHHKPRPIPPDLLELMQAIRDQLYLRMMVPGATDTYPFEGYEALDVQFGGLGMVIEARDPELDRKVAIKLWIKAGPQAVDALLTEARTLAKLSHPNVVTIHTTGRWKDRAYFVMEWVEGMDGHKWLEEPRPWREVRDAFLGAAKGLAAAHDAGIQHRDFKPANMLVGDDGRVRVSDFGVAHTMGIDEGREVDKRKSRPAGTPVYMAPERLRGGRGDARSDQFSFCVALWRGLHGYRPFAGSTIEELAEAMEAGEILPGDPQADVPHWLSRVVRKGLEAEPDRRHADMHELVQALQDEPPEQEDEPSDEEDVGADQPEDVVLHGPEPERPWPAFFYAALAGAVVVAVVAFAFIGRGDPPPTEPPATPTEPTLTPPERVLEQISGACVVAPGTSLVSEQEFWAACEATLNATQESWASEVHERRLAGYSVHRDALRVAEAFLEKARVLEIAGPGHECALNHRGTLRCSGLGEPVGSDPAPSSQRRQSALTAVSHAATGARTAKKDAGHQARRAEPNSARALDSKASKEAAADLLSECKEVAARLRDG